MIKQLQLRGISRTPSDRAVADGGCAESLNVHLEYNETAPTLKPQDISQDSEIYGDQTVTNPLPRYPIIYIHKMLGVTNYIGQIPKATTTSNYGFYAYGSSISSSHHNMGSATLVPYGETVKHITSIGNTLIIFTDKNPYYFLYKGTQYSYLGNTIPRPVVEVVSKAADADTYTNSLVEVAEGALRTATVTTESGDHADRSRWNDAKVEGDECHTELLETMDNAWGAISQAVAEQRNGGHFVAPFFVRYALRLYDGTYINSSTPILCGAGKSSDWATISLLDNLVETDEYTGRYMQVKLNNIFDVRVKGSNTLSSWGDIVKSIDFFVSEPIYTPSVEAAYYNMESMVMVDYSYLFPITLDGMSTAVRSTTIKNAVISKGQFYKVKSIELSNNTDMTALEGGEMKIEASVDVSGDNLYTQEQLPDSYRDAIQYIPIADAQNFNNRLMLIGADEVLSRGDVFLNSQVAKAHSTNPDYSDFEYELRFKIVNPMNGSENYVMAHYRNDSTTLRPAFFSGNTQKFGNEYGTVNYDCIPYAWICYPDTRCTQVELTYRVSSGGSNNHVVIPMEKHPLLECSYAFLGMSNMVMNSATTGGGTTTESRTMRSDNKLLLSEFENPFLFPAENIVTFKDKLIGAAATSVPLAEGQFGEYPLYAFTEGGIRVLVTTAEGTIAAENADPNLSRHVALPGTITGIEQAVVFTTKKGVMLLSGRQVTEISANMNGKPYTLDNETKQLLTGSAWYDLLAAADLLESTATPPVPVPTFMGFMENAKPAYDHNGARLLFFNKDKSYQYEYRLETQTWHKMLSNVTNGNILNSYPECLISYNRPATPNDIPTVLDFSTVLDDASILYDQPTSGDTRYPIYGIIATRPFDLGEPDVRKSISSIRIRGKYNRADVQYVLLGSFDDIHWQRLSSLHGGSYKLFRMVLLTKLNAMERITWIDVEYESRMTNKLR